MRKSYHPTSTQVSNFEQRSDHCYSNVKMSP